MRALFVSSGKAQTDSGLSPIIEAQGKAVQNHGVELQYFGIENYWKDFFKLRRVIREGNFDVIHAHYNLSAFLATLVKGRHRLVVSLMGDDVLASGWVNRINQFLAKHVWSAVIVKSRQMFEKLDFKGAEILPNGVNMEIFSQLDRDECLEILNWDSKKIHILFGSDPKRYEKNFPFFKASFDLLDSEYECEIHYLKGIKHSDVPVAMNAANVVVLSSLWEGSPNVIKESMACNRPIVSTNVGDVSWVIGKTKGCYISSFSEQEFARKLNESISFSSIYMVTNGRDRIYELGLDSESVLKRILEIYQREKS